MIRQRRVAACVALLTAGCATAPVDCGERELAVCVAESGFQGTAHVVLGDEVLLWQGFGEARSGVPNGPATRYRIGSLTKSFTAAAVARLATGGRLSFDDPLSKWVPEFPRADEITLHHLLSHQSGVAPFTEGDFEAWSPREADLAEVVDGFQDRPLRFTPGSEFLYSDPGYLLLGLVVERVTGASWEDFLEHSLLAPESLDGTGYVSRDADAKDLAEGHDEGGDPVPAVVYDFVRSSGGLVSTTNDLTRWTRTLLSGGVLGGAATRHLLTPNRNEYAYGWIVTERLGRRTVFHNGQVSGFFSFVAWFPDEELSIVLLSNRERPTGALAAGLARAVLEGAP